MTADDPIDHRSHPPADSVGDFADRLARVRERIAVACEHSGRSTDEVRLLPVSKTVPSERLRLAATAGCRRLAENKVQEAARKREELADLDLEWAVIGHLQSNKAKDVAAFATEFHALDRLKVAEGLERRLEAADRTLDVFVQVNTSGEDSKYGLPPHETLDVLERLRPFERLRVRGLMTLAVFSDDADRVRPCFAMLRELRDRARERDLVGDGGLSMGMSGDYELAIAEGATVVRVGQAIFGSRPTPDAQYWPQ